MRKSIIIVCLLLITGLFAGEEYTLEQCLDIAVKNNPDMVISKQQVDISQNQLSQAWGSFLPSANAGISSEFDVQGKTTYKFGGVTYDQKSSNSQSHYAYLSMDQTLYNSALFSGFKLAKNNVAQASLSKNQTRQNLTYSVTEKFYAYLKAQELLKVYEKAHKNSLEQLKKTEEMHRLGQVTQKDVLKAKVKEGGDRLNIINQKQALHTAAINLRANMGLNSEGGDFTVSQKNYVPVKTIALETAQEYCFTNNVSLRLLEEQKRNAELQYQMAKADYLPTLSADLSYYRGGEKFKRTFSEFDKWWNGSVGLSLNFSIFQGFKRKNEIQIKKIQYNIYDEQIRKEQISLMAGVDELVRTLDTYQEMLEINEINLNSAKEDLRLAQEMYKLNSATFLEVLDAQAAFTKAESDIISIKYDMKIIEVQLKLAMGTL
eukprot:Anaeramoba_ignava/a609765_86.p1 GENE.a609765_86~~a609765_86.p1  ORF type:complete len:432 (-),score=76.73 a609765_86:3313-4608(-)